MVTLRCHNVFRVNKACRKRRNATRAGNVAYVPNTVAVAVLVRLTFVRCPVPIAVLAVTEEEVKKVRESIAVAARKVTDPSHLAFNIGEDYNYIGIAMADCLMPLHADEWFTYNDDAFHQIVENGGTL